MARSSMRSRARVPIKNLVACWDLKDHERGLGFDGRFSLSLPTGLNAYWTALRDVKVEVVTARCASSTRNLWFAVSRARAGAGGSAGASGGVLFIDGDYAETLPPGLHTYWGSSVVTNDRKQVNRLQDR
jgi:hypothetical protein